MTVAMAAVQLGGARGGVTDLPAAASLALSDPVVNKYLILGGREVGRGPAQTHEEPRQSRDLAHAGLAYRDGQRGRGAGAGGPGGQAWAAGRAGPVVGRWQEPAGRLLTVPGQIQERVGDQPGHHL